jgi:hypothetical protein
LMYARRVARPKALPLAHNAYAYARVRGHATNARALARARACQPFGVAATALALQGPTAF